MKIAVIGTGYVGLVTGTCLSQKGHRVTCVDIDEEKVKRMQAGQMPIYEPGLEALFKDSLKSGHIRITTDLAVGIKDATVIFFALPTPPGADGSADLSAILHVADQLGTLLDHYTVIIDKSTVPVGTGGLVYERISAKTNQEFDVVSNPEFLREGLAVGDFMHPNRVVIGSSSGHARQVMRDLYKDFVEQDDQLVFMDIRSAEMTKYAANSFLAMKITFMNEVANLCEQVGANIDAIRLGIGPDHRIGKQFLRAGIGYGGSCFPKDVQALQRTAQQSGYDFKLLDSIIEANTLQKQILFEKVSDHYGKDLAGKHFALWGLAFKPDTDDIREAPSLGIIKNLLKRGATIAAYDPKAAANVHKYFGNEPNLSFVLSPYAALEDADALLVLTEWEEFRDPDFDLVKKALRTPTVFDGRNMYDPVKMQKCGFDYKSIGRPIIPLLHPKQTGRKAGKNRENVIA